jgi:hypothetical protein
MLLPLWCLLSQWLRHRRPRRNRDLRRQARHRAANRPPFRLPNGRPTEGKGCRSACEASSRMPAVLLRGDLPLLQSSTFVGVQAAWGCIYSNSQTRCTGYHGAGRLKLNLPVGPLSNGAVLMKARIAFYFAAVVALVLFLAAAVPSHATQHRDPALTPSEMVQRPMSGVPPAHTADLLAPKPPATTKNIGNTQKQARARKSARRTSPSQVKSTANLQGHTSSMGTK